jgi:hypothetical protein
MPMLLLKSFAGTRLKKLALDVVCSVRNKLELLLLATILTLVYG